MNIRHARAEELSLLLSIYDNARLYMRANGNPHQWNNGYPNREVLLDDLAKNQLYVCEEADEILGVFCYFEGEDPTYQNIYHGNWLNSLPYGVLHRIAVSAHRKGVAGFCFQYCFARCGNLKIDTHRDNIPMQKSLEKNGFHQCGIIYLASGDERLAYQKARKDLPQ